MWDAARRARAAHVRRFTCWMTFSVALTVLIAAGAASQSEVVRFPYCPSASMNGPADEETGDLAGDIERLSPVQLAQTLMNQDTDRRLAAAGALRRRIDRISSDEREFIQQRLIAALTDPNIHVRESVAAMLHAMHSPDAEAALARSLDDPEITDEYYFQATGRKRPLPTGELTESTFPPATVTALRSIAPDFLTILANRENAAVRQLMVNIDRSDDPEATPVLVWLLANGDMRSYGGLVIKYLTASHPVRLSIPDLARLLPGLRPDHRLAIVQHFEWRWQSPGQGFSADDRAQVIAALIARVGDPNIDVSAEAVRVLGWAHAVNAAGALVLALDRLDASRDYAAGIIRALEVIGSREALPVLERCARSAPTPSVRASAASAVIAIAKPADPGTERRRLLWEQPDTELEQQVLREGRSALPLAHRALHLGSEYERRAAAALLGWVPDTRSIIPILIALTYAPDPERRAQLLFDLNMILLQEGAVADVEQRRTLAAEHLRWFYDEIGKEPADSEIRGIILRQKNLTVFPDRVDAPFSVTLSTRSWGLEPGALLREFSTTAVRAESPDAFRNDVASGACGVAFHPITIAEGVARVATTVYFPQGKGNHVWISLYRNQDGKWMPLQVPFHPVVHRLPNEPNLVPTINRNYGAEHPFKILQLDVTMERLRVDPKARQSLDRENVDNPAGTGGFDKSYIRLLDKYKGSDSLAVKYTAEFESAALGEQPNLQLWIETLAHETGTPYQAMATQVLAGYASREIDTTGRTLTGSARRRLVAAALNPKPVNRRLVPQSLPRLEHIRDVRASRRFGLIDVAFGSGPLGRSGYSMLFERRGTRWVFLCVIKGWIS